MSFVPVGKGFAGARQADTEHIHMPCWPFLYIMALSWIEHEMVRYDSVSRVHCSTALRVHMERWLKAGARLALNIFSLVFTRIAAGVHDWSTANTVNTKSPPCIYCPVDGSGLCNFSKEKHAASFPKRDGKLVRTFWPVKWELAWKLKHLSLDNFWHENHLSSIFELPGNFWFCKISHIILELYYFHIRATMHNNNITYWP